MPTAKSAAIAVDHQADPYIIDFWCLTTAKPVIADPSSNNQLYPDYGIAYIINEFRLI